MVICMLLKTYIFAKDGLEAFSCTNENVVKVLKFIAILFNIAKILVPIILIVTGVISLAKAVVSDERDFSKEITSLVIKLFVGLFVFLLPTILLAFIDLIDGNLVISPCMGFKSRLCAYFFERLLFLLLIKSVLLRWAPF